MMRCLGERALFRLSEGEGTPAERVHLSSCERCTARLHGLESAVGLAARAMREGTMLDVAIPRIRVVQAGLLPLAATLVLAIGVASWMVSRRVGDEAAVRRPVQVASLSLGELSQALALTEDADTRPAPDSDVAYLQAALTGGWPCEQQGAYLDPRCD